MSHRKNTPSAGAAGRRKHGNVHHTGAKPVPARRRFVVSIARREVSKPVETNGKSKPHAGSPLAPGAKKLTQSGQIAAAAIPVQSSVDLTETIKTLLHLAQ